MIKTYKVLSLLLDYPDSELSESLDFLTEEVEKERLLDQGQIDKLKQFIKIYSKKDLDEWQREYVQQFDYSPQTNLYLFDYVYGDSKERGQAMIDLVKMYEDRGLVIDNKELPDYLPAFLEYISTLDTPAAGAGLLDDIEHILVKIGKKLKEGEHPYHLLTDILLGMIPAAKQEKI